MKVLVRGVHMTVDDRLRAYLDEHLVRPVARLHDGTAVEMDVAITDVNGPSKGGVDKECSVSFRSPHFDSLYVSERGPDAYTAVDQLKDRLVRMVSRQVERRRSVAREAGEQLRELRRSPEYEDTWAEGELPQT